MASQNATRVMERWIREQAYGETVRKVQSSNCFYEGPVLYSYGHHFTLARALKDKKGATSAFLLNGDLYSVTTSRQQTEIRQQVQRTPVPSVIIPFSVLNEAGIEHASVRPLDVTKDRHDVTTHTSAVELPGWRWRSEPVYAMVEKSDEAIQVLVDKKNTAEVARVEFDRERYDHYAQNEDELMMGVYERALTAEPRVFTREDLDSWDLRERVITHHVDRLYTSGRFNTPVDVTDNGDGTNTYTWTTSRHWLGESLIQADVTWTEHVLCGACGGRGRRVPDVTPLAGAVSMPEVKSYEGLDRNNAATWAWGSGSSLPLRLRGCPDCNGRGGNYVSHRRKAKFLSGFDHNERTPSYFFCELRPGSKARTVEEAYEDLKPDVVKQAETAGRGVKRQGDIFAVELPTMTTRDLRKIGGVVVKGGQLLGTNHVATEVASMPNGVTLARGTLTHAPQFRAPDHRRVRLGTTWHVIVKNTVPVTTG